MVAYAAIDDLKKAIPEAELIRLTDDSATGAVVDSIAQWAIDTAEEEIDWYIGQVVDLPLSTVYSPLGKICQDLAVCNLYARVPSDVPDVWVRRCERAHDMLAAIASGRIALTDESDDAATGAMKYTTRDRQFTPTEMKKYW
jgi:phage gp36-like protein